MDVRHNLRELFVSHEMPEIVSETPPESGTCEVIQTGTERQPWIMFRKPEGSTVLIIGEGGENILAVSKPARVIVPFFVTGGADQIELAIQDRLQALLDSAVRLDPDEFPTVKPDQVVAFLGERLGKPLKALIANAKTAERIPNLALPVYDYCVRNSAMPDNIVYGVAEPRFVGHIANTPRTPLESPTFEQTHAALMLHGRVIAAQLP
jgi:hypothetical protein